MKIALLNARKVHRVLERLISGSDEIHIAVAWGYNGKLADTLMDNIERFRSVTFGLNGFATSPDLVDRLIKTKNTFIAKAEKGIFHPKLYLFRKGDAAEAIVGRPNFTNGGLDRNHEACLHVQGDAEEKIFEQIRRELKSYDGLKQEVTRPLAESYRRQYEAARKRRGPLNPVLPNEKNGMGLASPLASMSWDDFAEKAREDRYHNFERRIALLREIQELFASVEHFSDLHAAYWKGIAGTLGPTETEDEGLERHDWGWFGTTAGNGNFKSLVARQDAQLGAALDCIPRKDPVNREDFDEYCRLFRQAFLDDKAEHMGGHPTATRLLAMKRPDTFVCANGKNTRGLAAALSFAPNTLSLDNYWDRVIVPIQSAPWYNAARPGGDDSELWDYRVAMLDTIYYEQG